MGVQFEIDANGILHVLARNLHTREEQVLKSAIDVTDQQVTEIESSLEHVLEDMDLGTGLNKLKADQLTQAAQSSLVHAIIHLHGRRA